MGKKASAPPAPDYAGAAKAQGAANVEAARASAMLSNPNIYGPLGSQTVTYQGDIPTVTQTLTPEAQATLQAQQQVDRRLAELGLQGVQTAERTLSTPFQTGTGELNTVFDLSGLPRAPVNAGTTAQEAIMARLEPQIQRSRAQLETQLANQGLSRGGEAYNAAIREQQQQENDLRSQAALQGIGLDTQARAQAASEQQAAMGFENQARAQALQRELALRSVPLNEIIGLMGGSQIQMPQFGAYQGQQVAPAPIFGAAQAAGQNAMQQYGISQSGLNAQMQGLGMLAGSALRYAPAAITAISDRRLKSNIVRIGEHPLGIGDADPDRLLHIDVFARSKRGEGLLCVIRCRRGDGHHIHRVQKRVQIAETASAQRHRQLGRPVGVNIEHAGKADADPPGVLPCVIAAEHARTDHTGSQGLNHGNSRLRGALACCQPSTPPARGPTPLPTNRLRRERP